MDEIVIGLASDHAGYRTKEYLKEKLVSDQYVIKDFGCGSDSSCDYPDYAHPLARAVEKGECGIGITLCGSGNGINMVSNKYQGIRSAVCWNLEMTKLARTHNNANVCALPARYISMDAAWRIVQEFISTGFDGGRHEQRIKKIPVK